MGRPSCCMPKSASRPSASPNASRRPCSSPAAVWSEPTATPVTGTLSPCRGFGWTPCWLSAASSHRARERPRDVGASTGGFTDCLLQRGARHVVALDVAYGELAMKLRDDPRVTVLERMNARALDPAALPYRPDLVVADVSFISLTKVLPAVLACVAERFDALVMVKPQFEVGRERVGKGGVVRDPALRREALVSVAAAAQREGAAVLGFASSG